MPFTKVDEKGRMVLPNEIRRKMKIAPGDEFVVDEVGPDTILIRKVDVRAMIQDAIERAKSVDLDKLQNEMEEEGNRVARKMYKVLLLAEYEKYAQELEAEYVRAGLF